MVLLGVVLASLALSVSAAPVHSPAAGRMVSRAAEGSRLVKVSPMRKKRQVYEHVHAHNNVLAGPIPVGPGPLPVGPAMVAPPVPVPAVVVPAIDPHHSLHYAEHHNLEAVVPAVPAVPVVPVHAPPFVPAPVRPYGIVPRSHHHKNVKGKDSTLKASALGMNGSLKAGKKGVAGQLKGDGAVVKLDSKAVKRSHRGFTYAPAPYAAPVAPFVAPVAPVVVAPGYSSSHKHEHIHIGRDTTPTPQLKSSGVPGFVEVAEPILKTAIAKAVAGLVFSADPATNGTEFRLGTSNTHSTQFNMVPAANAAAFLTSDDMGDTKIVQLRLPVLDSQTMSSNDWCATFDTKPPSPLSLEPCGHIDGFSQHFGYNSTTGLLTPLYTANTSQPALLLATDKTVTETLPTILRPLTNKLSVRPMLNSTVATVTEAASPATGAAPINIDQATASLFFVPSEAYYTAPESFAAAPAAPAAPALPVAAPALPVAASSLPVAAPAVPAVALPISAPVAASALPIAPAAVVASAWPAPIFQASLPAQVTSTVIAPVAAAISALPTPAI